MGQVVWQVMARVEHLKLKRFELVSFDWLRETKVEQLTKQKRKWK